MDRKRKITLGVATLAVALGAGHLVQSRNQVAGGTGTAAAVPARPTGITPLAASALPDAGTAAVIAPVTVSPGPKPQTAPQAASLTPKAAPTPVPVPKPAVTPAKADPEKVPAAPVRPEAKADACRSTLDVLPGENGMLELTLLAPCNTDSRVVLRHGGLTVTARTSTAGALFTALPAMESSGEVSAMFPDGSTARGAVPIDLGDMRRFAIQWTGDDRFALNAYAGGAAWGEPGHVHDGASGRPQDKSGWMIQLGDASVDLPMMAEVYTWPAATADVTIDLEAAVSDATCNRELLGETLDSRGGQVTRSDITLAMPDCSAVGDTLVLNNLLTGMTTAAAE